MTHLYDRILPLPPAGGAVTFVPEDERHLQGPFKQRSAPISYKPPHCCRGLSPQPYCRVRHHPGLRLGKGGSLMFSKKILTTAVLTASLAASSLLPLATAANARDWHSRGSFEHGNAGGQFGLPSHRGGGHWNRYSNDDGYGYGYRRHHHDNTGRNLAIGAFATILGIALAAEAGRDRHDYYDERD